MLTSEEALLQRGVCNERDSQILASLQCAVLLHFPFKNVVLHLDANAALSRQESRRSHQACKVANSLILHDEHWVVERAQESDY